GSATAAVTPAVAAAASSSAATARGRGGVIPASTATAAADGEHQCQKQSPVEFHGESPRGGVAGSRCRFGVMSGAGGAARQSGMVSIYHERRTPPSAPSRFGDAGRSVVQGFRRESLQLRLVERTGARTLGVLERLLEGVRRTVHAPGLVVGLGEAEIALVQVGRDLERPPVIIDGERVFAVLVRRAGELEPVVRTGIVDAGELPLDLPCLFVPI